MKTFLSACIACALLAVGAWKALETQQVDSADRYATSNVRLDDAARLH